MDSFELQKKFYALMIEAFNRGLLNKAYQPYIDWKSGKRGLLTEDEIQEMRSVVRSELEQLYDKYPEDYKGVVLDEPLFGPYRGYGKDAEKVSFLDGIEVELCRIYLLLYA